MAPISKAKVFYSGRSQAVRIPAEFRFKSDEVFVRRDPQSGDLILSESPAKTWREIFAALDEPPKLKPMNVEIPAAKASA